MTLADFLAKHADQTAWLFGKGPSLSSFDFSTAGPLRVAINDVAGHVPNCVYAFANDGVRDWCDVYKPGQILFQPERCLSHFDSTQPNAVRCDVVTYRDCYDDRRLLLPAAEHAEMLCVRRGTLGSALQILRIMGVKTVHLVGIDGGNAHATGYQWRTRLRADHWKDYDAIKHAAIDAAELMGMTLKFHNQSNAMTTDGKTWIRFTRNCFAEGVPYSDGAIAKLNPRTVRDLLDSKSAELFEPPGKIEVETATAPMDSRESAVIETAKSTPKKRGRRKKA